MIVNNQVIFIIDQRRNKSTDAERVNDVHTTTSRGEDVARDIGPVLLDRHPEIMETKLDDDPDNLLVYRDVEATIIFTDKGCKLVCIYDFCPNSIALSHRFFML